MYQDYEVCIDTDIYDSILSGMTEAAEACRLPDIDRLPGKWTAGTSITKLLDGHLDELYELMDKYNNHTVNILPTKLKKMEMDLVEADEQAASAIDAMTARRL